MRILIVGAGLSGCALARLLVDRGHHVRLIERKSFVGGLCITRVDRDGLKFEPFGARTFHTKNPRTIEFITRFGDFNGYVHRKGMIIDGRLFPFPITRPSLDGFPDKDAILRELGSRPPIIDRTNFETACVSLFGPTLYKYFIQNYTQTMWGIAPTSLTAEWAPKRLELRDDTNDELFRGQWQGLPVDGYSRLLERMVDGIPVELNTIGYDASAYDVVVSTAPIDAILAYRFGRLAYRSIRFHYQCDDHWEKDNYGTINLPQHPRFIRKCNFKILHRQASDTNRIQYHEPVPADGSSMPMYPVNTVCNDEVFDRYLKTLCANGNICPTGRLGLFKYLDMDKAVEVAFDMVDIVLDYPKMCGEQRYAHIRAVRERY